MKTSYLLLGVLLFGMCSCTSSPPRSNPAVTVGLPYCFVEESPDAHIFERVGHIQPIDVESVLLLPVVENGVINGKQVRDGLGSPLLYKPGTDAQGLQFKGIDVWPVKRYMVWARGYYMREIPRVFLSSDIVWGKRCYLVELTPLKPGTDSTKLNSAFINEMKKGEIIVEPGTEITDDVDYGRLFRGAQTKSWIKMPRSGFQKTMSNWGAVGSRVEFLFTEDDFKLTESYLRGETNEGSQIRSVEGP